MTLRTIFATIGTAACVAASPAAAATIDFDELRPVRGRTYVYGPYESDGFRLSSSNCPASRNGPQCFVTPANTINNIGGAGAALVNFAGNATVSFAQIAGGLFSLDSIVLASNINNASGLGRPTQQAVFTFNFGDGTSRTETRTIDSTGVANRNLLNFGVGGLSSFSFQPSTNTGGFLQFDDITVTPAAVAAVPEPASWAMMIAGFGLVGQGMRRRRRAVAFA